MTEDLDSLILMTGAIPELGLDGGDGIGGPGGGSGFTQPVMASLGAAYGVEEPAATALPPNPTPAEVLAFIAAMTGSVVTPLINAAVMSASTQDGVNMSALMASIGQSQTTAAETGSAGGMTATELMMIMQMLQPTPPPEPEGMHPAVMASIGIGAVSVVLLVVALLMGRSGGRNVGRRALLRNFKFGRR